MEKFAKRTRLLTYGMYAFYKKRNNISNKDRVGDSAEMLRIAKKIWEVTARRLIENDAGVVLDKFGYLCHWMTPKKKVFKAPRKGGIELMPNYHSGSYFYNTTIFTNIFKSNYFKGWGLDKAFNKNIKKGRFQQLKSGKKYKLFYRMVKRIYTNRFHDKLDSIT